MQNQRRSGMRMLPRIVACGALLVGACTRPPVASPSGVTGLASMASHSIFVGRIDGEFGREMRAAVGTELQKSQRYRIVDDEASAEYVLSGTILLNTRPTNPIASPPAPTGSVNLLSRVSGAYVWQYTYQDQRTGAEFQVPPVRQQVNAVARQVVAQLLRVGIGSSGRDTVSF